MTRKDFQVAIERCILLMITPYQTPFNMKKNWGVHETPRFLPLSGDKNQVLLTIGLIVGTSAEKTRLLNGIIL